MLQGNFLTRDHLHICDKSAHGLAEKDEIYLRGCVPDLYVVRWLSRFLKRVFPRRRSNARAYSRILSPSTSGSGLPYPIPPWHFPLPSACTAFMAIPISIWHQEFGTLGSWQSQHTACQRTGP